MKPNPGLQKTRSDREGTAMRTDLSTHELTKTNEKPVGKPIEIRPEDPLPPRMPRR